jgi:glycosyltransferase involved in cell wall biosynthesis
LNKIKILFAIDGLRSGGKERRFLSLLSAIDKKYQCEVIIFNRDVHYKDVYDLNCKIHFLIRRSANDFTPFYKFYKIAKAMQPHIIHVWDTLSNLYSIPTAILLNSKLITSKITDAPPGYRKWSSFGILSEICFRSADLILANSEAGIKAYDVSSKNHRVIYNGFDFQRLKNLTEKKNTLKELHIKEEIIITMVASFSERKDFKTFLSAANIIRSKHKNIAFICVGDGPLRVELQKEFEKEGVYFLGRRNDVERIMNASDIGVLMSNNEIHGEGISNSLLEFMALSKPVIASDNGGNSELIESGKNGILLKENNPDILAEKIIYLKNNKAATQKIGLNGRQRVKEDFESKIMISKFEKVYREFT